MSLESSNRLIVYGVLIAVGLLGAASDAVLNQWAKTGRWTWLVLAYASWLLVATLLGLILRWGYFSFGVAVVLFLMVNSLGALVLDYVLESTRPNGWTIVGLVFAMLALFSIEMGREKTTTETPVTTGLSISR